MTEASRFPHLALPFAITGAAGGWLSASLVANPLVQRFGWDLRLPATVIAAALLALAGSVLTRWSKREPRPFIMEELELLYPRRRPLTDRWPAHALVVLFAGALTGWLVTSLFCDLSDGPSMGALAGTACAAAFVPVCLTVLAAARRAKRARLGSLVSASDRRAVWGILATTLSLATLEALPGWPASAAGEAPVPWPAVALLAASALLIGGILVADARGRRRAQQALVPGLLARDPERPAAADLGAPQLDLGLGEGLAAHVARAAAAYRGQDRTLALVQGDADRALSAFRRATVRGVFGLVTVAVVACAHVAAQGSSALAIFDEERCESFGYRSCHRLAEAAEERSPERAMSLYDKACSAASPESCVTLGWMYMERDQGETAARYFGRACKYGQRGGCLGSSR